MISSGRGVAVAGVALATVLGPLAAGGTASAAPVGNAGAAAQLQADGGFRYLTNGLWPDRVLCASPSDDNVYLSLKSAQSPYCQWLQFGGDGQFMLYNPIKNKVMSYHGGNQQLLVMMPLSFPASTAQYFSWGGWERWGARALQAYIDSGQNVDAKDPNSNDPRTDAVRTRGWRHGHQMELTWNAVPVSG